MLLVYVIVRIQNVSCILASPYLISIEKEEAFAVTVERKTAYCQKTESRLMLPFIDSKTCSFIRSWTP